MYDLQLNLYSKKLFLLESNILVLATTVLKTSLITGKWRRLIRGTGGTVEDSDDSRD